MDHGNAQNVDTNIPPSSPIFPGVEHLLVREWFITIQGEAPFAGVPALFLRLGGCNLGAKDVCVSCDTSFEVSKSKVYDTYTLAKEITDAVNHMKTPPKLLVITGGEPLLQLEAVFRFLSAYGELVRTFGDMTIQFETNGTIDPRPLYTSWKKSNDMISYDIVFVVSPKAFKKDALAHWWIDAEYTLDVTIRQVISPNPDSAFHWPDYLNLIEPETAYLSPVTLYKPDGTVDMERTLESIAYAKDKCIEHGFNLSLQSHVFAGIR